MNLCSDNHNEVCFETRNCPACDALSQKDKEISKLEDKISELEVELENGCTCGNGMS